MEVVVLGETMSSLILQFNWRIQSIRNSFFYWVPAPRLREDMLRGNEDVFIKLDF